MITCSCTRCGCEATAITLALVEAMRWTMTGARSGDVVPALCPACRRATIPEPVREPGLARVRTRMFEPVLRRSWTPIAEGPHAASPNARVAVIR
jgi:hypothetical protein